MMRRRFLLCFMLPAAISGCFLFPSEEKVLEPPLIEPPEITYRTVPIARGTIEHELIVTGTYEFTTQHSVYFTYRGGRLENLYVQYAEVVAEGELIAEIEADSLLSDIELQEISVEKAEINLTRRQVDGNRLDVRVAELDLAAARIRLRDLKIALERRRVYAPIEGRVVYLASIRNGDFVEPYQIVARIADTSEMLVTYQGSEAPLFKAGYPVELRIGDETYAGNVVMTPATAPPELSESQRNRVLIKPVDVSVEKLEHSFIVIRAVLAKKDNVVIAPRRGVREYQNSYFVHVLENNVRIERPVEIGMETPTQIEIVKGLSEGELLILQ